MQTDKPTLHQQIMNLPDRIEPDAKDDSFIRGYRFGHRDARHAAAELVAASSLPPPGGEPVTWIDPAYIKKNGTVHGLVCLGDVPWPGAMPLYASPLPAHQGEDAKDAARYRWLRDQHHFAFGSRTPSEMDEQVDAARPTPAEGATGAGGDADLAQQEIERGTWKPRADAATSGVPGTQQPEAYAGPVTWTPEDEARLDAAIAKRNEARAALGVPASPAVPVAALCERLRFAADNDPTASVVLRETMRESARLLESAHGVAVLTAPKLEVWFGAMPESNGKANWTAILHRGDLASGHTIDRSEHHDRVRYEADRVRWLIGELADKPDITVYDEKMLSPEGWTHPCGVTGPDRQTPTPRGTADPIKEGPESARMTEDEIHARDWWCPHCKTDVPPEMVTKDGEHYLEAGGCGRPVRGELKEGVGLDGVEERSAIEAKAREIYDGWRHHLTGWVPWVEGGNSHRQDEARRAASRLPGTFNLRDRKGGE
jgi:hypothetical protein